MEKISTRIITWSSRHISYAGRVVLINTVLFGMLNYWAQIFILPKDVIDQVTKLCRNFLWGGEVNYSKNPYVGWDRVCCSKKKGRLEIKNFLEWNKACIAKLVWAITKMKDGLWIKWVHGRYIQDKRWEDYTPKGDTSWY